MLETLKLVSTYVKDYKKEFTAEVHQIFATKQADTIKFQQKRLAKCQLRHSELDKLIQRIYEDNVLGKINDSRFATLSNQYELEQHDITREIDQLQVDISTYQDTDTKADSFLKLASRYTEFTELTPAMLHEFVDKIEIHERAEKRVRSTSQLIDIHLNFIGTYVPPIEYIVANQPEPKVPPVSQKSKEEERLEKRQYQQEYKRRRKENGGLPLRYKNAIIASMSLTG